MHNSKNIEIQEYEKITGNSYDDARYPSPSSVPKELLPTVARIKVFSAAARQLDIRHELEEGKVKNGIVLVEKEKEHLLEEFESLNNEQERWSNHTS